MTRPNLVFQGLLIGLIAAPLGCEAPQLADSATKTAPESAAPATTEPSRPTLFADAPPPLPEDETPITDVPRKFNSHDPVKGRRSRDAGGYLGAVGGARFHAEYQTIINNIDYALRLFEAEHGQYPKSHEEFMQRIVAANGAAASLPELPPGREYIYVPEQAEVGLQVRLIPGSPESKLPTPAPGEEHIYSPAAVAAAGVPVPGFEAAEGAPVPSEAENAGDQPAYDIRSRAESLGDQGNSRIERHGLAPGGLAPVGGLE